MELLPIAAPIALLFCFLHSRTAMILPKAVSGTTARKWSITGLPPAPTTKSPPLADNTTQSHTSTAPSNVTMQPKSLTAQVQVFKVESVNPPQTTPKPMATTTTTKVPKAKRCVFPEFEPWSYEAETYIHVPQPLNCSARFPLVFSSSVSAIIPIKSLDEIRAIGIKSCCYRVIERHPRTEYSYKTSSACYPVSLSESTDVPDDHEFVAIECAGKGRHFPTWDPIVIDVHAFPFRPIKVSSGSNVSKKAITSSRKLNVLFVALDGVSRMNFLRVMPETHKYLVEDLSAVEMKVYNKFGPYTFENQIPMFTNLTTGELGKVCAPGLRYSPHTADACPTIWSKFKERGYVTGYSEDTSSSFHIHMKGFAKQPTDLYLRPLILAAERHIASTKPLTFNLCAGPRLYIQVLLNYVMKINKALKESPNPYFYLNWIATLGHDESGYMGLGDEPMKKFLQWMQTNKYFKDTLLILTSDHGVDYGRFAQTTQGTAERLMPLMYFVVPKWFQERYPRAHRNLKGNTERLVTPFDLYETMHSLLNLDGLSETIVKKKESELKTKVERNEPPRGVSLFLPVPVHRTCSAAKIEKDFCACL